MGNKQKDIKAIFSEAIEKQTPKEQAAYLDEVCGKDAELREKIEGLLKAHQQAGSFLEIPDHGQNVTIDGPAQIEGPGTKIGRYELLELIGEGGMGLVYLANQKEPVKRKVALKIVKLGMDTKQVVARFEAERQALALLDHPNIAHVFDAGTTEAGRPYFVMEYVKGMSITRYCDEHRLDVEQRLRLFREVCEGVHHAHQKGIIHRDLKPSNILVSLHGDRAVPKIIDFGIAKAAASSLTEKTMFTFQGQLLGTPEYMSPEQVDLATQDIDTRSDIYSLGVVLYELLAGVLPFERESLEKIGFSELQRTLREQEPASPSVRLSNLGEKAKAIADSRMTQVVPLARRLHRELEWIPLKAMRKDRCRRYKSASDMADDIQSYLNGNPLLAGPETAMYRMQKFVHKHAGSVATAALVSVAVILGLVVSVIFGCRAEQARQQEEAARIQVEQALARAEKAEEATKEKTEELRRTLYVNSIQLADAKHKEGNAMQVRSLLDSCPEDLRGWEWNRLNYIQDESLMTLCTNHNILRMAAVNINRRNIVTCGDDKTIKVWDLTSGDELRILRGHNGSIYTIALSPDGKHIASGDDEGIIKLWDAQTGAEIMTINGHQATVMTLAFSPDGKLIASGGYDRIIKLWDTQTGVDQITLRGHKAEIYTLAFSPDGKRIVSGSGDWTIKLWDAQAGVELATPMGHDGWVRSVAFSPESKRIVSGSQDRTIKVWDAETGDLVNTIRGHIGPVLSVVFSQDSDTIASGGGDNTVRVWDANSGDELKTFHGHDWNVLHVAFSSDGNHLISASMDSIVKQWDMMIGRESYKFHGHRHHVISIAFSPDGRQIVSGSADSTVRLWDSQTGLPIRTMYDHGLGIWSVAFSPDGKRVVSAHIKSKVARVWDTSTGTQLLTLRGHKGIVMCVAFSPDGKYIVSGSDDGTIKLWNSASGVEMMTLQGHSGRIWSVAFSPDGKHLISGNWDKTIKLWDTTNGSEVMKFQSHKDYVRSVSFSPDGKRIVSSSRDQTVKIWDAETGGELMNLAHPDAVSSAEFNPDGTRIVTGCRDGRVRLWDSETGAELLTLAAEHFIYDVAFSPDGYTIAAGVGGGNFILWESTETTGGYEQRRNIECARKLVEKLHDTNGFYHDVIRNLQSDTTIDSVIHNVAIQIANSLKSEDAEMLRREALDIVASPANDIEACQKALEKIEKADAWEPNDPAILNTLGAARYRLASYEDALKILAKSKEILSHMGEEPDPLNIAFTTMTLHKIGRAEEAKATLERLRALIKEGPFAEDMDVRNLLAEAERLIAGEKQ